MRRAQTVLDALVGFGLPVRGATRMSSRKALLNKGSLAYASLT
jgi:hypothetical protein